MLKKEEGAIVTIEDPIEYAIEGIEQIQVNPRSSLNFANGLRAILRQDPDIIMVGEIRDRETAAIAVNSALTGHLLLSTLHTNDAVTTIARLYDMGIEPYLIASTLSLVIGQRLVRKSTPDRSFKGRLIISEILVVDEKLKEAIIKKSSRAEIEKLARQNGFIGIQDDGFEKASAGLTTKAEVMRVTNL
jgi:type II secretory ATPase GspE/PulE/Tfp pilus assembly ATPase PilB-like protein